MIGSPDELARAPCFSGSHASLITGFTYGTFDLELVKLDVADCIHDSNRGERKPSVSDWSLIKEDRQVTIAEGEMYPL